MTDALLSSQYYEIIEGRHGRFLINPHDMYIGRSMKAYGEFSEREWALFDQILRPGMVVIEAGANMGSHTVPIAKKVGMQGFVYAFEPQLAVFQQLCTNLALNDLMNVQAFHAGCGAEDGWMKIVRPDPAIGNNFGGYTLDRLNAQGRRTPARIRIETLDNTLDLASLNFLKADVEGMEVDVLKGASGLIARHRPVLYLEAGEEDAPALIDHVLGLDYRMWWHLPWMFNPDNHAGNPENLFENIASKNVLCLPAEAETNVTNFREVTGPDDHPNTWGAGARPDQPG